MSYIYIYIWSTYSWCFYTTHNAAAQSVELLWTSDQLVAETSTWQHTTLTRDKYPCPRWDSNPRSQQASGPAARLLRSWVRIPPGAWIFVCCECRVLSGRGLCDELITRLEESHRLCCGVVCDLETSKMGAPYIYDISRLRVKHWSALPFTFTSVVINKQSTFSYTCL